MLNTTREKSPENFTPPTLEENLNYDWDSLGMDFDWDAKKIWKLELPITEIAIKELLWHFEVPFWERDDTDDWNLTPWEVVYKTEYSKQHQKAVNDADLSYPIDIMEHNGRWLVLDGLHRLLKTYQLGNETIKVRIMPREKLAEVQKDTN